MQKQKIEIHVDNNDEAKIIITDDGKGSMKKIYNYVSKDMLLQKYQIMIYQQYKH